MLLLELLVGSEALEVSPHREGFLAQYFELKLAFLPTIILMKTIQLFQGPRTLFDWAALTTICYQATRKGGGKQIAMC